MRIKKVYRVFDNLHLSKEDAIETLKGWEHKENITERFVLCHKEDIDTENNLVTKGMLFNKLEDAQEELKEML